MYDVEEIVSWFVGLIGWRQNDDPNGTQLDDLLTSETGLFFNDVHPLLTFDNIESIAPNFSVLNAVAVDTLFTNWLRTKTRSAIIKAINAWSETKVKRLTAQNLLSSETLFVHASDSNNYIMPDAKLCGLEIIPQKAKGLRIKVRKIGVQFSQNQTINISLFQSGQIDPVQIETVTYTGDGSVQWINVEWTLKGEGGYYLAYDQKDLLGFAINSVTESGFNSPQNIQYPRERFMKVAAFQVDADDVDLWNLQEMTYNTSSNFGLNMQLDVVCDYTDFIIEQRDLFKNLIWLQVGIDLLREMAFNSNARLNRNEQNIDYSTILYEIDGDSQGNNSNSLNGRYCRALEAIQFDSSEIDRLTMPVKRRSVKYKAIGPKWRS